MTPQTVIDRVRLLINDTDSLSYRYSDSDLVLHLNQILQLMLQMRPDLFLTIGELNCAAGILQSLGADGHRIAEVFGIKNGSAVTEVNREALDYAFPSWRSATPATPVNWMRHPREATKFFVTPPAEGTEVLIVEYVKVPATYSAGSMGATITELSDAYTPIVVSGVTWLTEAIDDEHVNSGRAKIFQEAFVTALGASQQAKTISDSETGGVGERAA